MAASIRSGQPAPERHLPQQRRHRARLPRAARVRLGTRRRRHPGVVGPDLAHRRRHEPAGGRGLRRARPGPLRRHHHPRRRRGRASSCRSSPSTGPPPTSAAPWTSCSVTTRSSGSTVGAVGFCMGGGFVLVLAAQQGDKIGAAVPFYGVLGEDYPSFANLSAPMLGHFGEQDTMATPDAVKALADRIEAESGRAPRLPPLPGRPRVLQRRGPHGDLRPRAGRDRLERDAGLPPREPPLGARP